MSNTYEKIYCVVKQIPYGNVASYGQIAALSGNNRWARVVGYALHNCNDNEVPCHRVVNRLGAVSDVFICFGENVQITLLKSEGVKFLSNGCVNMALNQWNGNVKD